MTTFAIGVAGLVMLAGWMLRPAWRAPLAAAEARPARLGSAAILGEQLAALDREHAAGAMDALQRDAARSELQRRVLDEAAVDEPAIGSARSPKTLLAVGLAVPLFSIALYAAIGNPAGLGAQPAPAVATQAAPGSDRSSEVTPEVTPEAMQAMLASLAQRLEKFSDNPASDLQGWTMLARSYAGLQRFADADRAFARAIALAPRDAQLLADRADVLAVLQGQRTAGEPERLIAEALRLDPRHPKALALAGSAAFERQDYAAARRHWQQARALAADGSAFSAGLDRSLAAAREASGDTTSAVSTAPSPSTAPASARPAAPDAFATAAPARITGRVSLAPALAARAAPTDTVFIVARAAEGSRMPLAVIRRTVADLPFDFTLDDSLAMSPQMKLSGASRVVVSARVSRAGNAMPQAGDLRGESAVIGTSSQAVRLSIDSVQP